MSAISKLTTKYQATIPKEIRELLHLHKGDHLRFDVDGDVVTLHRAQPLDLAYLQGVEGTLSEWLSDADEEAYRDL